MKKLVLLFTVFASTFAFAQNEEVIMTVDGKPVYKSEFEYIFRKNNKSENVTQKELDEYMDLFVKFKLKVTEARELKLDTLPKIKSELEGYRAQLAQQYLFDNQVTESLIQEAYSRMQQDVHASHILARTAVGDTMQAFKKIWDIYKKLENGENFTDLAAKLSEDPSAKKNKGDLGYFSAFRMIYPFETAAYNTEVGKYSKPVRTRFGYHIIYVHDKRPARAKMEASHILVKVDSTTTDEKAKAKIDEIYGLLKNGSDFSELATSHSDDGVSSKNGGALGWFSPGEMVPEFEDAAHALNNDGDFSKPFRTEFGWHIVKRTGKKEIGSLDENLPLIKSKINRDERAQRSRKSKIEQLKREYNYKVNADVRKKLNKIIRPEFFENNAFKPEMADKYANDIIFTFADQKLDVKSVILYTYEANNAYPEGKNLDEFIDEQIDALAANRIITYERANLENKYPKFRALMDEYTDGVLLFELTDQKVWGKAIRDTSGLQAFYEANKTNFMWKDRADVSILTTSNKKFASKAYKMMSKGIAADSVANYINKDSQLNIKLEQGVFETSEHDVLKNSTWEKKLYKPSNTIGDGSKYYIINIKDVYPAQPKKLNEARGLITSKYQDKLEKDWLDELNKKYKIEVNKNVLYSIK
ncbi:MAG: peptidylprolyl isomerase [Bacteroidia bacterium]